MDGRLAGRNERRCIIRDELKLYGSVVTLATYKGPKEAIRVLQSDELVRILRFCVQQHAVLQTTIHDEGPEQTILRQAPNIDLTAHIDVQPASRNPDFASRAQALLEKVQNVSLYAAHERPPWRVYITPLESDPTLTPSISSTHMHFDLAFACSHSLADGLSGPTFHASFVKALRHPEILDRSSDIAWAPLSGYKLLPPLEAYGNLPISWSFLLPQILPTLLPSKFLTLIGLQPPQKGPVWTGARQRPTRNGSTLIPTAVKVTTVSHDLVKRIIRICRIHNSRLTGLLNLFAVRGISKALLSRQHLFKTFKVETAIDMRGILGKGKNMMANYVSASNEVMNITRFDGPLTSEDWADVQRTTRRLERASGSLADQPVALLKYVDIRRWTIETAAEAAKGSLGTSNLGVFDADGDDHSPEWTIQDLCFSQSASGTGDPLNLNAASTKDGSLTLTLTWWPGMLGVDDESVFVSEILEYMKVDMTNLK